MNRRQEALIRKYARAEISRNMLEEGLADTLKTTITKLAKSLTQKIDQKVSQLQAREGAAEDLTDFVLDAEGGSAVVTSINKIGSRFKAAAEDVMDVEAELPAARAQKSEATLRRSAAVLSELNRKMATPHRLDEVSGFEIVGLGLAMVGGIPMLLKGLYKVARLLKMERAAERLEKMYHAAHHFEEGFVDFVVPDRVSYVIYTKYQEAKNPQKVANYKIWAADPDTGLGKKIGAGQRILSPEEYAGSKEKKKLEKGLYVVMLTPWLINGLLALKHFVSNVISWAEAGATAVKGVEAGEAAAMAAELVQGGASSIDDITTALTAGLQALD
jgi:hypothetical protein